jgi:hypothetical protein
VTVLTYIHIHVYTLYTWKQQHRVETKSVQEHKQVQGYSGQKQAYKQMCQIAIQVNPPIYAYTQTYVYMHIYADTGDRASLCTTRHIHFISFHFIFL